MTRAAATVTPRQRSSLGTGGVGAWLRAHRAAIGSTLQQFGRQPLSHILTIAVLATTLILPIALFVLLHNTDKLLDGWNTHQARMSAYLRTSVDDAAAARIANTIAGISGVASAQLISREQALEEYRNASGFGEAIAALGANPLPATVIVEPAPKANLQTLLAQLRALPEVESVSFDLQWVQRLQALTDLARRVFHVLAIGIAMAVLFVASNAIRIAVAQHQEEIEIYKLVGATDAYIRRPFLYAGVIYGILGALIASTIVAALIFAVQPQVRELAQLYGSNYFLTSLDWREIGFVAASAALLGLISAWLTASHHIRQIAVR
ncbi:MAG: permease-like cell division protein FtsX [Gammaproteobacteria bacterium]